VKRVLACAFCFVASAFAAACSSNGDAASGASTSTSATATTTTASTTSSTGAGGSGGGVSCAPVDESGFAAPPWIAPHAAENVCSSADIDQYLHDCLDPATAIPIVCQQFTANKASCAACLLPMDTSMGAGALLTKAGGVEVNVGGCIALGLGDASDQGCGAREAAAHACADDACAMCDDASAPDCHAAARAGTCASFQTLTCPELAIAAECALDRGFAGDYRYVANVFCAGG